MKIRVSTAGGETLFFSDVLAIVAQANGMVADVRLREGMVLCVEAISDGPACVKSADMRDGLGALAFAEFKTVPPPEVDE